MRQTNPEIPAPLAVTNSTEIDALRKRYRTEYFEKFYSGWSDEFDKKFDSNSGWFRSESGEEFCRVTYQQANLPMPIETSDRPIVIVKGKVCEINNFLYTDAEKAKVFIAGVLRQLSVAGIDRIYCIVDNRYKKAYRFNTGHFGFCPTGDILIFDDIKYRKNPEPAEWMVLKQTKEVRNILIGFFAK